jgi:hypothetical protein
MAAPAFSFNPYVQTSAAGMFTIESDGFIAGTAMPDPAARFALAGGILATTETLPMFGGLAISENIPQERPPVTRADVALGGLITRGTVAPGTGAGAITGFSVFDQNYAAVNTPTSPVPTVGSGGLVNFYRLGSGARVALAADPALAAAVETGTTPISAAVYWDATNLRITATVGTNLLLPIKLLVVKGSGCMVPSYNAGTGLTTWAYNGSAALCLL